MKLDHFAVSAQTLDEGRAYVEDSLGAALHPGGKHAHYGTHNMLLGLEDGLYLEVIAIDPNAPKPDYPRWFDLDRFRGRPRPTAWICQTDDMDSLLARFPQAGCAVSLQRGDLRWQMAVPDSGILAFGGLFPPLIEWQCTDHPANLLPPSGCRLIRWIVTSPDSAALKEIFDGELNDRRVVFENGAPGLRVELETPSGPRVLE